MTLALAPLPAWLDLEERRAERRRVAFETTMVQEAALEPIAVKIVDMSKLGCQLSILARTAIGRRITLALPSSIAVQGVIAWVREGRAGLDFLYPLPELVIDQLISSHGMADCSS